MSTAVQTTNQSDLMPTPELWQTLMSMAKAFLESRLLPAEVDTPQKAVLLLQKARELNLPPTVALAEINIIKGKPSCSANLLRSLIFRDHGDDALVVVESTESRCVLSVKRRTSRERQEFTFTAQDAQRAGLTGGNWQRFPAAMMLARCTSHAARAVFPDSIAGLYLPDELDADVVVEGENVRIAPTPLRPLQVLEHAAAVAKVDKDTGEITPTKPAKASTAKDSDPAPASWLKKLNELKAQLDAYETGESYDVASSLSIKEARELKSHFEACLAQLQVATASDADTLEDLPEGGSR